MTFREKLSRLLDERRMDLRQLSTSSGMSYEAVRSYVKPGSGRVPSAPNGISLAHALNVTAEWLFDDGQAWPPPEPTDPSFQLHFWPPILSWPEVQAALALFAMRKLWTIQHGQRSLADALLPDQDAPKAVHEQVTLWIRMVKLAKDASGNADLAKWMLENDPTYGKLFERLTSPILECDDGKSTTRKRKRR
jgi:hypothetical protein